MEHSEEGGAAAAVDWEEVRRVYEAREVPVSAILAEFGISGHRLRQAYLKGGWLRRPQVAVPIGNEGIGALHPRVVLVNLFRTLDAKLKRLDAWPEAARETPGPASPAAEELWALAALARALERVMREDRKRRQERWERRQRKAAIRPAAGGGFSSRREALAADDAFMREEIKQRLDTLAAALEREAGPDGRWAEAERAPPGA